MAYRHGGRPPVSSCRVQEASEIQTTHVSLQASPPCSASYGILQEEKKEKNSSLQEQLIEKDQYITRLQETLRLEREKNVKLQSRFNQQGLELRRREQHANRMREKLFQFTDRHRDRGASIEVINALPKPSGRREPVSRTARADGRKEQAVQLMLERREAELRESMKLRHSLTTLLHALRTDMQQTLQDSVDAEEEEQQQQQVDTSWLVQSEQSLGDHVTGGVVLEWTEVKKRLRELQSKSTVAVRTDQEKFLAQLEEELEQSRELVRVQQQLLQDNVDSPLPAALIDSYYLEEWERLQDQWVELKHQRRSFQQERQAFTEAAIRLGHERCVFQQQKAALMKQQFLTTSPIMKTSHSNRRESTALGELRVAAPDSLALSPCAPITPSSEGSEVTPRSAQNIMTPSTPELYSVLQLNYCRSVESPPPFQKEPLEGVFSPEHQNMDDWPF
ncbi:afadin- and alpha-actinin-binding protein B isoform X1 [Pygocentrus nattereri]|uniref:Afadin- and alpha-actinin-binding protein-like n=1 Tax=Pygocentrus nattereri TaxID=42514 RepID=A0A3B4DU88_PYGNA|nr:afadin- and alpha-actinin-binding protein B isoform X1 [Pygocentrus nattereri]